MLSAAKDLLLVRRKQVLRYAQDDGFTLQHLCPCY